MSLITAPQIIDIADQKPHEEVVDAHLDEEEVHHCSRVQQKHRLPYLNIRVTKKRDWISSIVKGNGHSIDEILTAWTYRGFCTCLSEGGLVSEFNSPFMDLGSIQARWEFVNTINSFLVVCIIVKILEFLNMGVPVTEIHHL